MNAPHRSPMKTEIERVLLAELDHIDYIGARSRNPIR